MDLGLGQNGFERGGGLAADSALPQTLTPALSQGERGTADPLELIASGSMSLADIARTSGMSILELAEHVCTTQNLEALARVKLLHATQQEMLLGELKRDALMRLGELTDEVGAASANEVRACEVMRKACVDLLRYGGSNTEKRSSKPGGRRHHRESITPATEAEVLEALERWGREDEEEEYPQITQIAQMNSGGFKSKSEHWYEPDESRGSREPSGPPGRTSGSVEPAGWSKAEPQATSGGRGGQKKVHTSHAVQVGMTFRKTSDHGTGELPLVRRLLQRPRPPPVENRLLISASKKPSDGYPWALGGSFKASLSTDSARA